MENLCMRCGRIVPEGRHICLLCEGENEVQVFRPSPPLVETNIDAIRLMNVEQLAAFLLGVERKAIERGSRTPLHTMLQWLEARSE